MEIIMNREEIMANKIRDQYTEKKPTKLDELKALDSKVKNPANAFAYVFGSVSAIIMGCGMSLIMTDISKMIGMSGDPMIPGVIIGAVGLFMAIVNYPMHKRIMNSRKKQTLPKEIYFSTVFFKRLASISPS